MDDIFLPENILEDGTGVKLAEMAEGVDAYWADDSADKVMEKVWEVREEMRRRYDSSSIFNKIERSQLYYYGFFDQTEDWGDTAISVVGQEGQVLDFTINYYRYLLRQLLTMVTSERPAYRVNAANTDVQSRVQARLGRQVLDFYLEKRGIERIMQETTEDALVKGIGFVSVTWNPAIGEELMDENIGEEIYSGDVEVRVLDFKDVIWEFDDKETKSELRWIAIKKKVNRWDLAARFPEHGESIMNAQRKLSEPDQPEEATYEQSFLEDWVDTIEFYHRKSEALPDGRMVIALDTEAKTTLIDIDNPYRDIPVYFLRPSKIPGKLLGWTPAFDIQKQQELLNEELGKIATIHDNLDYPLLWTKTGTKQGDPALWLGNIAWVESDTKPELVELSNIPEDVYRTIEMLIGSMEKVVGLSPTVQGEAAGSVRANRMQLFMAEQSRRFNSTLEAGYFSLFEDIGTAILRVIQDFSHSERVISLVGVENQDSLLSFTAGELYNVVGVSVQAGSPITRTTEGRLEIIQLLSQNQIPLPKEEIVSILNGAPLESITRGIEGQNEVIAAENESLMKGGEHFALATDNQLLHIKKHANVLNTPRIRVDPEFSKAVLGAMMEHLELYNNPTVFGLQMALGYATMPPTEGAQAGGPPPGGGEPPEPAPVGGGGEPGGSMPPGGEAAPVPEEAALPTEG